MAEGLEARTPEWSDDPVTFAKNLRIGDHSILIFQDSDEARTIEAAFLSKGLGRGEYAIYLTAFEDPAWTSKSLEEAGMDRIDEFLSDGRLRILKIRSPADEQGDIENAFDELYRKVFSGIRPPFRLVGRLNNLVSENQVVRNIQVETMTQKLVGQSGGSIMCSYDMSKISDQVQLSWLPSVIKEHHALVSAPGNAHGVGFYMR